MKQTSLYAQHCELKAKFAEFAGWNMPIQYSSVKMESSAVRASAGVFDVSHMGEFFIEGSDAVAYVDYMITNDFAASQVGKAVYSPLCDEQGKVIDDLICYKISNDRVLVCVNAGNIDKDFQWFKKFESKFKSKLTNLSEKYSLLALQGPDSEEILKKLEFDNAFTSTEYYGVHEGKLLDSEVILARTGYTGEDGFEIFCDHDMAKVLWSKMMELNVAPCGLAARDVLRLEVAYPLYGHEIDDSITPLDAALKWTVKLNKTNFIGKSSLENYTPKYRLLKLILDKGIPRQGYEVLQGETVIGSITSGTMSVALGKGIALARIDKEKYIPNSEIFVNIRSKSYQATVSKKAFVTGGHK
jgi:aminomethyltransferase